MTSCDLARLLKSEEIQKAIRAPKKDRKHRVLKRNPLKNIEVMVRLNPYAAAQKKSAKAIELRRKKIKQERMDAKRGIVTEGKSTGGAARPRKTVAKPTPAAGGAAPKKGAAKEPKAPKEAAAPKKK